VSPNPTLDMEEFMRAVASPVTPVGASWRPLIVALWSGEFPRFETFCSDHRIALVDTIDRQLTDLAVTRLPSATDSAKRHDYVEEIVAAQGGRASYGSWVYLPWELKIVHVLDREAYFDVITDRNRDKITRDEQQLLRTKRIGVIGLSVGGEAAVTVAQEHLCGAIVLADFDRLDLSNLNRLNAGCDDLGEKKATIVARRIAKVNPYLEVTLLDDGVTAANLGAFVDGVDLIIEECDDLPMKREIRLCARARGVDIVFAADERGFLSIEPYASYPQLRPFHGRIEDPQPPRAAFPTPLAFMKALTVWMGGWDQISERSRLSLARVGETLSGYPQLASEARYAAGQLGHVVRRLLLGERLPPFVGNLDLAHLVPAAQGD